MNGDWTKLTVITTTEAVEAISEIFIRNGGAGVEIHDPKDFDFQDKSSLAWDYVDEDVLRTNESDDVFISTYFTEKKNMHKIIDNIKTDISKLEGFGLDIGKGEFQIEEVNESDWANNWKKYYKPYKAGSKIVVKPSWEDYDKSDDELIVELDPGMAFGTGTHETTSMCIELIEKYLGKNDLVFDIGTGSGILAISAAKLGAKKVLATDLDENAVRVARENVDINKEDDKVEVYYGNLAENIESTKAQLIVANIIADVIVELAKDIPNLLDSEGIFISSGIIKEKKDMVINSLESGGFEILQIREKGEWLALVAKQK